MITYSRTIIAAVCLLVFAAGLEFCPDPCAVHREAAASSSLRAGAANVHMDPVGRSATIGSLKIERHTRNESASPATGLPVQHLRFAESVSHTVLSANIDAEKRTFSARPPPTA